MKRTELVLIVFLVLPWLSPTPVAAGGFKIAMAGEMRLEKQVKQLADRLAGSGATMKAVADSATSWLSALGYLDASASFDTTMLTITTGKLVNLKSVQAIGDSTRRVMLDLPFTPENLQQGLVSLVRSYQDSGYYFCRAQVAEIRRLGQSIYVTATVASGPVVAIKRIDLNGLSRTKPTRVSRYLSIKQGALVTDETLHRLESDARGIPFVDFISPANVKPLAGYSEAVLELTFRERQQVLLDGGAGYDPEGTTGLVWKLNGRIQNLFGEGRDILVQSARQDKGRNLLDIEYLQPLFLLGNGSLNARVATRNYRDEFYEFTAVTGMGLALNSQQKVNGELSWTRVDPDLGPGYRRYQVSIGYALDQRRRVAGIESGFLFESTLGYAYRTYSPDSLVSRGSFNDTRARFGAAYCRLLAGPLYLFGSLSYRGVETREQPLPVSEQFYVGGPGSLRGYRTDQFAVQRTAGVTVEPRWSFGGGYLFAFYDGAYLNSPVGLSDSSVTAESYRFGFGGGLTVTDRQRSVTLSLGWNPDLAFDQPQLAIQFRSGL